MTFQTKKSLGQHFLRSERALLDMAEAIPLSKKDTVLEIGPGEGVLTEKLLASGASVIAVEKDDRLIPILSEKFSDAVAKDQLTIVHGDVVEEEVLKKLRTMLGKEWVLVANIPYYITGLILRTFLDGRARPTGMVLLVQKEVAEDIVARDGKESIGSIAVKVYGTPSVIARVPRGAFVPPPSVDSAVLKILDIQNPFRTEKEREHFFDILRMGFKSRRKTILNTLSAKDYTKEKVGEVLLKANIDPKTRPERLTVGEWRKLAQSL